MPEASDETAALPTEIAGPAEGLLPLIREAVVGTCIAWSQRLDAVGEDPETASQLENTAEALSHTTERILLTRNHTAHTPDRPERHDVAEPRPATSGRPRTRPAHPVSPAGGPDNRPGRPHPRPAPHRTTNRRTP